MILHCVSDLFFVIIPPCYRPDPRNSPGICDNTPLLTTDHQQGGVMTKNISDTLPGTPLIIDYFVEYDCQRKVSTRVVHHA